MSIHPALLYKARGPYVPACVRTGLSSFCAADSKFLGPMSAKRVVCMGWDARTDAHIALYVFAIFLPNEVGSAKELVRYRDQEQSPFMCSPLFSRRSASTAST